MRKTSPTRKKAKKLSSLEERFIREATAKKLPFEFEAEAFTYVIVCKYNPDFKIANKKFIETKGYFDKADRRKMKAFVKQHPEIKVYMLFGNPDNKITKGRKTTYADWCRKNGIEWYDFRKGLPTQLWGGK